MADVLRYRRGDANPIEARVDSATVIQIGDCVFLDTNDVKPAADLTFGGLGTAQELFRQTFLGVSESRSRALDTAKLKIDQGGVHEFICASATFNEMDLVGMDDNAGGTALENQTVIAVTDVSRAIGRVVRAEATAVTKVLVEIKNMFSGGLQEAQASA